MEVSYLMHSILLLSLMLASIASYNGTQKDSSIRGTQPGPRAIERNMNRFSYSSYHDIRARNDLNQFPSFWHFSADLVTNLIVLYIDQGSKNFCQAVSIQLVYNSTCFHTKSLIGPNQGLIRPCPFLYTIDFYFSIIY